MNISLSMSNDAISDLMHEVQQFREQIPNCEVKTKGSIIYIFVPAADKGFGNKRIYISTLFRHSLANDLKHITAQLKEMRRAKK